LNLEQQYIRIGWRFTKGVAFNKRVARNDIAIYDCPSRRSTVRPEDIENDPMFPGWDRVENDCRSKTDHEVYL
jgi:hypothetical protein